MVAIEVEPVFKAFRAISVSSALKCLPRDVPNDPSQEDDCGKGGYK